jgi:hypothetical protein
MTRFFGFLFFCSMVGPVSPASPDWAHVRHILVKKDQVIAIKTAIGIATLIQVPDRPTSAIIGDTESFKVEYLDSGVTIKPLHFGAKTNLYIYTDSQRFNIHLIPTPKESADYIVYLKNYVDQPVRVNPKWRKFEKVDSKNGVTLKIKRLGWVPPETFLIEFQITSKKDFTIKPEWFWMTQDKKYKPIQNLILSKLTASEGSPIAGLISQKLRDLAERAPIHFEMRGPKPFSTTLPEVSQWPR